MADEIWAALIQAAPVGVAALIGGFGLNTWHEQLREGRHVKHAERALASAAPMFRAIQDARSRQVTAPAGVAEQDVFIQQLRGRHLGRALKGWERFQERYALAGMYHERSASQTDVAAEVADCLNRLDQLHRAIVAFHRDEMRQHKSDALIAFLSWEGTAHEPDDVLTQRLKAADRALQAELRPILLRRGRRSGRLNPQYTQPP